TAVVVRLPVGFAGEEVAAWPPPRAFPRPEALDRPLDVLPGVGPAVRRRLAKLGLETVADLLSHPPFRYERPVAEVRVADRGCGRDRGRRARISSERGDHAQEAARARRGGPATGGGRPAAGGAEGARAAAAAR